MKVKNLLIAALSMYLCTFAYGQQSNDDCKKAIPLGDITNYCSKAGEFSNDKATPSALITPCFDPVQKDVWFQFTPQLTDVNITIKGAYGIAGSGGTLRFPKVALYSGDCDVNPFELICDESKGTTHVVSIYKGGLVVGETYFLRVQGGGGNVGTFQICIENYNPPKIPSGDCPTGSVLCDKSSFVVQSVQGAGNDLEVTTADAPCFSNGAAGNIESNSTWFKWTCEAAGTLTFVLNPLKEDDDIDFVLFELPGGIENCTGKKTLRCMASGVTQGGCRLLGPTGLRVGAQDVSEDSGCAPGKDNFLAPLIMEVGKSYALMINNFTSTRSGFKMEFGGTGTFLGPTAKFVSNSLSKKVCFGEKVIFTDASKATGGTSRIVKWSWDFGVGGTPRKIQDISAGLNHEVVYNTPGKRFVVLNIESDKGCQVTYIDTFVVDSCCRTFNKLNFNTVVKNLQCQDILEGSIDLNVISNSKPILYNWSIGTSTPSISGLGTGAYSVTVENAATCDTVLQFIITAPPPIKTDTLLKRPTCDGGVDGAITLNPRGGVPPYTYDWGNGYVPINTIGNLKVGKYPVFIQDQGGCKALVNVDLRELELSLDPAIEAVRLPTCFGEKNGAIDLKVINGQAPIEYDFGSGFQTSNTLTNIGAGAYNITVKDANRCKGIYTFNIGQPDLLTLKLDSILISCYGANDGKGFAEANGGTPGYSYSWSGGYNGENVDKLAPGPYEVTVTDRNGCTATANMTLSQPPLLAVQTTSVKDVNCYGDKTGEMEFAGVGGRPPYQFSLDGVIFQQGTAFKQLSAGDYNLTVRDTAGCQFTSVVTIRQPSPFVVNAGPNKTIDLGDEYQINAVVLPIGTPTKSILWTPDSTLSCNSCLDPTAFPFRTTTYTVKAVDQSDCPAIDQITIFVNKKRPIFIPNVFSPVDANGTNDQFTAYGGRAARKIQLMRVFDRWGSLLFEGQNLPLNDTSKGWDGSFKGKRVNNGVYIYYIVVEFIDNEYLEFRGDITVMGN
ncbi:MAG: gliding motility-associated C-terminal domain-containing protein [Saprospiraceae bacterium]